jgi:hypothetical protein
VAPVAAAVVPVQVVAVAVVVPVQVVEAAAAVVVPVQVVEVVAAVDKLRPLWLVGGLARRVEKPLPDRIPTT